MFLCFVYFVSISRGLNRYDFERLLNGFVVCAVHIYITETILSVERQREQEKKREANSERSNDVCCEANTIHTHTRIH